MAKLAKLVAIFKGDRVRVQAWNRAARGRTVMHSEVEVGRDEIPTLTSDPQIAKQLNLPVRKSR